MLYVCYVTVATLWMSALVFADVGFKEKHAAEGGDVHVMTSTAFKRFAIEAEYEDYDAETIFDEAVKIDAELQEKAKNLPNLLEEAKKDLDRAKEYASKAKRVAIRNSAASGKSSIAQNAFNNALRQKGIVESATVLVPNIMKIAGQHIQNAKLLFDSNGKPKNEKKAKLLASKAMSSVANVEKAIDKAEGAAKDTKISANDAQRFSSAASVVASSSDARNYAALARQYFSDGEKAFTEIDMSKNEIEKHLAKLSDAERLPLKASIDAAQEGWDTAKAKLTEVKLAAQLTDASKAKVEEYEKQFDGEFEKKSEKAEELAKQTETEANLLIEHEKKGRTAFNELLDAGKKLKDAAAVLGVERDEAATPLLPFGVWSLIVVMMASVILL